MNSKSADCFRRQSNTLISKSLDYSVCAAHTFCPHYNPTSLSCSPPLSWMSPKLPSGLGIPWIFTLEEAKRNSLAPAQERSAQSLFPVPKWFCPLQLCLIWQTKVGLPEICSWISCLLPADAPSVPAVLDFTRSSSASPPPQCLEMQKEPQLMYGGCVTSGQGSCCGSKQ